LHACIVLDIHDESRVRQHPSQNKHSIRKEQYKCKKNDHKYKRSLI
jgi:hypothetical protein